MPRPPKGSRKEKNQSVKSSSSTSTSVAHAHLPSPNELLLDGMNSFKLPFSSSPTSKSNRSKRADVTNSIEETTVSVISSTSSEFTTPRVVVNPAVLRYLEQNRPLTTNDSIERREAEDDLFHELIAMDSHDESHQTLDALSSSATGQESTITSKPLPISASDWTESERFFHDDLVGDFSTCSTDFLPSARLAEWILTHAQ